MLKFSNARQGGVGDALPAGTVRVYMKDARGQAQFIGENVIGHTPGGSNLALKTGNAFDVKVQPVLEKRETITSNEWEKSYRYRITTAGGDSKTVTVERQKEYFRTTMRYIVTNAKSQDVTVDVIQSGLNQYYYAQDDRVVSETIKGEQLSANERLWQVPVKANGETVVTVVFESRY